MLRHTSSGRFWGTSGLVRWILALVVGIVALGTILAPAWAQTGSDPAPNTQAAQVEIDFLMGMIPHHRGAIMMAEMVRDKATRPELRELAQMIIEDQQREIALMTNDLRDWYGMEPPQGMMMSSEMMAQMEPMMHGPMPDMMARMQALETKTGADFDIEFMSAMIDHHAMAIMMAAPVLISGYHSDLYPLSTQIVTSQGEEIAEMKTWLKEWYGVERPL